MLGVELTGTELRLIELQGGAGEAAPVVTAVGVERLTPAAMLASEALELRVTLEAEHHLSTSFDAVALGFERLGPRGDGRDDVLLGDVPLLGRLFQRRQSADRKQELLIFTTPRLVDGEEGDESVAR